MIKSLIYLSQWTRNNSC